MGLALSAARLHQRVLLIDANLRNPKLHLQLDLPNERGLSTLLTGEAARPVPIETVMLLSSPRMKRLVSPFAKFSLSIQNSCAKTLIL